MLAFFHNHRKAIVAFDFFTVPTATFRVLYCFFVIEHERRRILHSNLTRHPSADPGSHRTESKTDEHSIPMGKTERPKDGSEAAAARPMAIP
jgi:hypothetical protein